MSQQQESKQNGPSKTENSFIIPASKLYYKGKYQWKDNGITKSKQLMGSYVLEVSGMKRITQRGSYKLFFLVKLDEKCAESWKDIQVAFQLRVAGDRNAKSSNRTTVGPASVPVRTPEEGLEFQVKADEAVVYFTMLENESDRWMKGIEICGVEIVKVADQIPINEG